MGLSKGYIRTSIANYNHFTKFTIEPTQPFKKDGSYSASLKEALKAYADYLDPRINLNN